jgi:hypothetical protein
MGHHADTVKALAATGACIQLEGVFSRETLMEVAQIVIAKGGHLTIDCGKVSADTLREIAHICGRRVTFKLGG